MSENENARDRLEAWVAIVGDSVAQLTYTRTSIRGQAAPAWTVTLVLEEPGPPTKVIFESTAAELKNAAAAVIDGLTQYGIAVPE